jgi:hypothetical protein
MHVCSCTGLVIHPKFSLAAPTVGTAVGHDAMTGLGARSLPKESGSLKTEVENVLNTMRAA